MKTLPIERDIMWAAIKETGNKKIKVKDIMEWANQPVVAQKGETLFHFPNLGVWAAIKLPDMKKKAAIAAAKGE